MASAMKAGALFGRYRLLQQIGRGGMGEVWLAAAMGTGGFSKKVVIKTILPERADDPAFVEMLTREARMCAELSHPNLIEVFDFSEHDGVYLLAMEYVVGRSLSQIVRAAKATGQTIPPWFALRIISECCRGLECAHANKIIHCDLSPGNIMLSFSGFTKVLDFGVAHSGRQGLKADRLKGKYHYMAPERIRSLTIDARTDVYSLGVILYVLFTGRLPISAPSDEALLHAIVNEAPRPPSAHRVIAKDIEDVISCAMQYDPRRRFQDVASLAAAIAACKDGHPTVATASDMAHFLGSLFPEDSDLPAPLRAALRRSGAAVAEAADEDSLSLLAYSSAELEDSDRASPAPDAGAQQTLSLAPRRRGGPTERATSAPTLLEPAPPRATEPASSDGHAVRRLFEGGPLGRPVARGLFELAALGDGTSQTFSEAGPVAVGSGPVAVGSSPGDVAIHEVHTTGATPPAGRAQNEPQVSLPAASNDPRRRRDSTWPWSRSLLKPT